MKVTTTNEEFGAKLGTTITNEELGSRTVRTFIGLKRSIPVNGWTLSIDFDLIKDGRYGMCGDYNSWYSNYGLWLKTLETTLNGCGKARLDFGNCHRLFESLVQAFLNGKEIGTATTNELSKKIEFDFYDGDTLKLVESNNGHIRFNNFTVVSCCQKNE